MTSPIAVALRASDLRRGRFALAVLLAVLAELAGVGLIATAAWLISRAAQQPPLGALAVAIVVVRTLALGRGGLRYAERLAGHDVTIAALGALRVRIYRALSTRRDEKVVGSRDGDLLSRLVADVDLVQDLLLRCLLPATVAAVVGVTTSAAMWLVLPSAGLVLALGFAAAGLAVPVLVILLARRAAHATSAGRSEFAVRCVDLTQGAAELAVFGESERALAAAEESADRLHRAERSWARALSVSTGLVVLIQAVTVVAIGWLGQAAVAAGTLEGLLVPVLALTALTVLECTVPLGEAALRFVDARQAAGRVAVVLAEEPVAHGRFTAPAGPVDLVLRRVNVIYPGEDRPALDGVDLVVPAGMRLAVIGHSGAGKTTLLGTLNGTIRPTGGSCSVGGAEAGEWAEEELARVVGTVAQDAHVFQTSIRENLLLVRPEAAESELRSALARARLLDWVDGLPAGLDTDAGQDGGLLSGGERQRLLLARAFLADPPVMLFDEPTEGLDEIAADALIRDVLTDPQPRTVVVVTHRTTGLELFDQVVVLDSGRIEQRGRPGDLLAVPGYYRDTRAAEALPALMMSDV